MLARPLAAALFLAVLAGPALAAEPARRPAAERPAPEPTLASIPEKVVWGLGIGALALIIARVRRRPPSVTA